MASGFMLADALNEALRLPYSRGNTSVTTSYLVNGLKLGEHRVLLKRNFETACWIPPVGKRGSHSIYYGDCMLMRAIDFFCKNNAIEGIPNEATLAKRATVAKSRHSQSKVSVATVFDGKVNWLKDKLSASQWQALLETLCVAVAAFGRHEREHARNTSQDLKRTNRDLRLLGIPFRLFNLFEDSRIEHISREEQGTKFGWLDFEAMPQKDQPDPVLLYMRCIQLEGEPDVEMLSCDKPFGQSGQRTTAEAAKLVQAFYQRACECVTDEHLYPIIVEFLKVFKENIPPSEQSETGENSGEGGEEGDDSGSGKGSKSEADTESEEESGEDGNDSGTKERAGDLSTAAQAAEEGDSFFENFDEDAEVVGGTDEEGKAAEEKAKTALKGSEKPNGKVKANSQGIPNSIHPDASGGAARPEDFLAERPGKLDAEYSKRVENLTQRLLQLFKTHNLNQALESTGRRMSSRHLAQGEMRYLHRKQFGGKGKRKYTVLYDCSGSMTGQPDREGKIFLLALNNLAKRGYLQGNLILSGFVGRRPGWLSYTFPVDDEIILRICTDHGSEGLKYALEDNLKVIRGVDDVFIYTDACINDSPMDASVFTRERVWPVGLYVGKEDRAKYMSQHFPQYIIRDTIEELVEKMLVRNRRTVE